MEFYDSEVPDSSVHLVVQASLAPWPEGRLFSQLLEQVRFYTRFQINYQTGEPLSDKDIISVHCARFPSYRELSL